jgi:hypothetical protein
MAWLYILILTVASSAQVKEAVVSRMQGVVAHVLLLKEPQIVWCRVEPKGGIWHISTEPGGAEIRHGATMTVHVDRPGDEPFAYYYLMPTPAVQAAGWLGFHAPMSFLLPTGREATAGAERWREFRRCSLKEFDAADAKWRSEIAR